MKKIINFKMLLIAIGLLATSLTNRVWADNWYSHNNNSHIYFNDYNSQWVSDPSSNGITFLMGRDGGDAGAGSRAYRMAHIEHTNLWYCYVAKWGNDDNSNAYYQYVAFRFAPGTTGWNDWQGGWDNRVTARAQYDSNTKYSQTRNDNITGRNQYYCPSSSSSNTGYDDVNNGLRKYTAYLRVNFDEEGDGTYDGMVNGDATWAHGVSFDYTGTYMKDEGSSSQSTISDLNKNGWNDVNDDNKWKWGYADIPITGEVTFLKKTIDAGFEITGWAFASDATSPTYTANKNNPTFQVLGSESFYVAFIRRKSYTVTLNDNGGSGGSGSKTVKYDRSTNMTTSVTKPSMDDYTFQGYFTSSGTQIIDANGAWIKNVTNYTGTDGSSNPKWVKDGGVTLYAKWTQSVTLSANSEASDVTSDEGSTTATYNKSGALTVTPPARTGCSVEGYYAEEECTHKVMAADGSLINYTGYVVDGKWVHAGATTLYAKWSSNNFVIYRSGEKGSDARATYDDVETYAGGTPSETIEYRMKVEALDTWYSLCLPFTVTAVKVWDPSDHTYYDLVPYYRETKDGDLNGGHYIIRTPSSSSNFALSDFGDWRDPTYATGWLPAKNTPYIIQWHMDYFEGKYVSFIGSSQTIATDFSAGSAPASNNVVNVYGNNTMHTGTVTDAYLLDSYYGSTGAWTRAESLGTSRTINPFECYLVANSVTRARFMSIRRDMTIDETPTGWENVETPSGESTTKILIDGQLFIIREGHMYTIQGTLVK